MQAQQPRRRHENQVILANDTAGDITIDLDSIDGAGLDVDYAFLHFLGGAHPASGLATVALTQGTLAPPVVNAPVLAEDAGGANWNLSAYFYVITALGATGETVISNQVTVTPVNIDDSVTITWSEVPGAQGYKIYRSEASGVFTTPALKATIAAGNITTFLDQSGAAEGAGAAPGSNDSVAVSLEVQATAEKLAHDFGDQGIALKRSVGTTATVTPGGTTTGVTVVISY